jgi:predicted transcriptional regulator
MNEGSGRTLSFRFGESEVAVAQQSVKQRVLEAVEALPADATIEDAMERLYFLAKIQRGLEQADAGDTMTHEEAKKRLLK